MMRNVLLHTTGWLRMVSIGNTRRCRPAGARVMGAFAPECHKNKKARNRSCGLFRYYRRVYLVHWRRIWWLVGVEFIIYCLF